MTPPSAVLDDIARRLRDLAGRSPAADLERNVKAVLAGAFTRLDLVTREEFDAQARLLARTREQLAVLEQRVVALESRNDAT